MNKPTQRLDLRQSQNLVMTPQLQQAIKLLQLSNIELAELVEEELANNPLLEKAEAEPSEGGESAQDDASADNEGRDEVEAAFESANTNDDFDAGTLQTGSGGNSKFDELDEGFESRMASEKTLREHLLEQLHLSVEDNRDRLIGALLIDRLDESGYLREDHAALAVQLGCAEDRLENLLRTLKGFDPTGVFAGSLEECLALQLEERGTLDAPMQKLLQHLKLLADHDLKKLGEVCGVNTTYLMDMVGEIRSLNPRPVSDFEHVIVQTAIPDVLMRRLPKNLGGGWRVELNVETLPRVLVNQEYYTQVAGAATQKQDKDYIATQLGNANWLIRAMDQRAQTILKVAAEIVEQQDAFFNYGIEFLKPLRLADIAEVIAMHESTVSRVTTNKYIGTPRGIFELKYFFSTALVSESGIEHSAEAIKARIRAMIEAEKPDDVLSDDRLVELLKTEQIDIARRTVAKYREAMNIPSTVQRRRIKRNT
jgi:RNA polymerase sigma-54 factor